MRPLLFLSFAIAFVASMTVGQEPQRLPQDTLAWVDGQPILARDLRARLELMPWPGPQRPSTVDSVKSHALSALVAERLLATEAVLRGLTMDHRYDLLRWGLTRVLLRDAMFRREVAGSLRPTRSESEDAIDRYRENRVAVALLAAHRVDADSLGAMIRRGVPVGELVRDPRVMDHDTISASFGMSDTLLERLVYDIGKSRVSRPQRMAEGRWILLWLVDRSPNPLAVKQTEAEQRRAAIRILRSRLDGRAADRFYRHALTDRKASADSIAFFRLARMVTDVWLEDSSRYRRPAGFELTSEMVDVLHDRMGESGSIGLVEMEGEGLTIEQVVELFRYGSFVSPEADGITFWNRLNEQVRFVAAAEYLARSAQAKGLISDPAVQADLRSWNEYWAAGEMLRSIRDTVSVTHSDLVSEFVERREDYRHRVMVEIEEVWSVDAADASRVAAELLRGASVSSLTSGRPKRSPRIGDDGRSGWFDPADDPVVGFHALLADSGATVGPVAIGPGYVTFRVLGIKSLDSTIRRAEWSKSLKPAVRARKGHAQANAFVAELAQRRDMRIEPDAVKRTTITTIPMFTRRYLGFGGWMNGAPMLLPLWEWIDQLPASSAWPL